MNFLIFNIVTCRSSLLRPNLAHISRRRVEEGFRCFMCVIFLLFNTFFFTLAPLFSSSKCLLLIFCCFVLFFISTLSTSSLHALHATKFIEFIFYDFDFSFIHCSLTSHKTHLPQPHPLASKVSISFSFLTLLP